ncbi:MAG: CPBP family intramembrane metalloprotease [Bacteroidaceae bacterium]|nr:CPBP family intramembrane metalloprotease [Bacteroidaceae bacterium]
MVKSALKTAGYILLLILAYMAFQACFTFAAVLLATAYACVKGYVSLDSFTGLAEYDKLLITPATMNIYIWAMAAGLFFSALAMIFFLYFIKGYRLKMNLFRSMPAKSLFYSTMLVLSSMFALNIFVQWLGLEDNLSAEFGELSRNVLGVITISLLAPLLEEALFRGAIQGYLMRRYNPWTGIVCAALVFGIFHLNPVQSVYAALIGVIFGWIYYRTGSLLSVIVGHVLNNSLAAVIMLLFPEQETLPVLDAAMSPSAQVVSEVFGFIFFAVLSIYFAMRLHRVHPPVPSPWRDVTNAVE